MASTTTANDDDLLRKILRNGESNRDVVHPDGPALTCDPQPPPAAEVEGRVAGSDVRIAC